MCLDPIFVETEINSEYTYHELGRYPLDEWLEAQKAKSAGVVNSEKECSRVEDKRQGLAPVEEPSKVAVSEDAEVAARVRFETDKNKHIELLLGGVSSTEFENLQSDRGSLDVCQISEDGGSECEAEGVNRITSRLSTERSHDPPATSTESATAAVPRDIRRVSFGCESSAEQCHDAPVNRGSTKVESKETRNASDRGRSHNSRKAGNNEQNRSTSSGCKDSTLSFSDFMAEMMRRWEPPPRYRRLTDTIPRFLPWRRPLGDWRRRL